MACSDSPKQLLTLIRDFAAEKSQGERRLCNLKRRIQELRSEIEVSNADLDDSKCSKEVAEQDLKGYEVELSMSEASIQVLETRSSLFQDEISKIGSDVEALKNEEGRERDEFIRQMLELNKKIRKFQDVAGTSNEEKNIELSSDDGVEIMKEQEMQDKQDALRDLEDKLADIVSKTQREEQEYQNVHDFQKKVQQEQFDLEKKVKLMEAVVKEMKELQELTKYPLSLKKQTKIVYTQTAELEEACTSMGAELQARCTCPCCHLDNMDELKGDLEAN
ncbi:hypothetical protein GIB67_004227 [Kingdonia uniflora]|uniref:Uncharacterized protein n=1 Tax=Kingdonia uniflora TaxID=39325 RepID=A0A7J7MQT4_9MAGN|nr:hypothetical protein GIB67_004227 [Kingdonia uniflora]